jgi:WD40 repeat protein
LSIPAHKGAVLSLAYSTTRLVSGGADGFVYSHHLKTGIKTRLAGHAGPVHAVAITPDSKFIVSAGKDKAVRVWSGRTHLRVALHDGHEEAVNGLALDPKGGRVFSCGDGVREWTLPGEEAKP